MPKTKAFIEKARAKHGDRYDYSKVVYVHSSNKVIITCSVHGNFEQSAKNHLHGRGCRKCGLVAMGRSNVMRVADQFKSAARAKHGGRYDYSKVVYVSAREKVTIACREHGDFEQTPNHHLRGYGCRKCAGTHSYSTLEWIDRAREKHGDIYGYYRTMYIGSKCKVIITCKEHGDFEQWPANHLRGDGCPACSYVSNGDRFRHSDAEFIERARVTHGDLYNYSKVDYIRSSSKVIITCKKHGDFEQEPASHLAGNGCSKCSGLYNYTTPEWIAEAKNTHGDKYDYGNTVYVRAHEKVIITCKEHGDFENIASQHLHGAGCQKCAGKHRYSTVEWVDVALLVHGDLYDYSKTVYVRNSDKVVITCKEHGDFDQTPANHLKGQGCPRCNWSRDQ